jgi:hypothetical protein
VLSAPVQAVCTTLLGEYTLPVCALAVGSTAMLSSYRLILLATVLRGPCTPSAQPEKREHRSNDSATRERRKQRPCVM